MRQHGVQFKLRAVPISDEIMEFLQKNDALLTRMRGGTARSIILGAISLPGAQEDPLKLLTFRDQLCQLARRTLPKLKGSWWMKKSDADIDNLVDRIWSFGPSRAKSNILFNCIESYDRPSIWEGMHRDIGCTHMAIHVSFRKLKASLGVGSSDRRRL